jgi:hypothetical protein
LIECVANKDIEGIWNPNGWEPNYHQFWQSVADSRLLIFRADGAVNQPPMSFTSAMSVFSVRD